MRVLFVLMFALGSSALAFSCPYRQPFVDGAYKSKLVVKATVLKYTDISGHPARPHAMVVRVEKTYRGKAPSQTLRVYGDNSGIPRPFITYFPIGSTWLFPLVQDWVGSETVGRKKTDYGLPVCSDGGLVFLGDQLFGMVNEIFNTSYPVKKIPELLKQKPLPYFYLIDVRKKKP